VTAVDTAALRAQFLAGYGFALDDFQIRALDAVDAGSSVLVAAPTSSGKTLVAEYAVAHALAEGTKAFYTAPIKALSNQKYADLVRRYGAQHVGLLTGDNSINGDAPVVVMTTEVLRNMIYAGSDALRDLRYVILDEVHYLQDAYRGPVWEEVIIHTPQTARLVCLSATVSNAEELADWMTTVRGPTATIIEERRPVELQNLYLIGDRSSDRLHLLPTLVDGRPNPEASRLDGEAARTQWPGRSRGRRRLYTPRRIEVVELLEEQGMLPAIYFIFSRAACSDAAAACLDAGLRLTTAGERDRIREIVGARLRGLEDADLAVLGYSRWMAGLEAGIAPHHAGLVPPFKEAVEACFVEGLVKVVFATETLALGINMPARSVVIEKLTKFTGERHQFLTPGEYTQLTGRAGRRGIDTLGHAIVLWSPFVPFDQVAGLASSRTFRLTSSFRPTYNMAANLVRTYPRDQAHHLLNLSFGQYQADRDVVRLEARLERRKEVLAGLLEMAESPFGDIDEYRRSHPRRERRPDASPREDVVASLARLKPGDVIMLRGGKHAGRAAVLTVAQRRGGGVRLRLITPNRILVSLSEPDFDQPVQRVGEIDLPTPFAPNRQSYQREVARELDRVRPRPQPSETVVASSGLPDEPADPILRDPQLDERLKAAAQADRVAREVRELEDRIGSRVGSLARRFDRVVRILETWGYLDDWALTESGERLASLFHESDLLLAEAIGQGLLDDLDPAALAGVVSLFTYEHRSPDAPPAPWFPSTRVRDRCRAIAALATELNAIEDEAGLDLTRAPDPTFLAVAHAWAAGEALDEVLEDEDLSGGDFVRNVKQVIDLLGQVADVTDQPTSAAAREAAARLYRGVVAASSAVATSE
jgi:ATP-dependent RNA helicase HelY